MKIIDRVHPGDIPARSLCLRRQALTYGRCWGSPLPEPVSQAAGLTPTSTSRGCIPLARNRVILGVGLIGSGGFIALPPAILIVVLVVLFLHAMSAAVLFLSNREILSYILSNS